MIKSLKHILKSNFLIFKVRNRFHPSVQIAQRHLCLYYQDCLKRNRIPDIRDTGFQVFSRFEEDGLLLFIFSIIGMGSKKFIEIGSDDGRNSNAANLVFNFNWHGLFIDSNHLSIKRGLKFYNKYPHLNSFKPQFLCSRVTRENVNELISEAGYSGEIELLSIDIDGNDYWIWDALQTVDPQYTFPGKHPVYHGASPVAMTKLARRKGYRLVGANELGFNFIYIKNSIADTFIPEVSVESLLQHPSIIEGYKLFEEIKDWEYLQG